MKMNKVNDTDEESTHEAVDAEHNFYCFTRERWNKIKRLCHNTLIDIDHYKKRNNEVLKDHCKFLKISNQQQPS